MTAPGTGTVSLAQRRHRLRGPHPALVSALDRRLVRLSARLAAHSITLREATEELHDVYVRGVVMAAQQAVVGQPDPVADCYVVAESTRAVYEVAVDRQRSALDLARAERRLGEVLVLPCGRTEGAAPPRPVTPLHPRDLW